MQRKLYIKTKCSVCRGKLMSCPYCDEQGLTFIEPSDNVLKEWFNGLDQERKKEILDLFNTQNGEL